ncbi:anti-sigma factor family protein [Corynebacterium choanae]|uniref:Anti-sigma-E factor RseA n=1 Tax=Corynebacterium choanae TaxID=1862358 RepID=A0A3G6JB50_9CORY|nr:zf-HC2 domain-containing protein [Corynebacterium choanae]AZA13264.1 Anti-sigma-E factor RseA [Corynebacterium choanae]
MQAPKNPAQPTTPAEPKRNKPRYPRQKTFASYEHLSAEAVAAFVDNELDEKAAHRARVHLVHCADCRQEVEAHRQASQRLKQAASAIHAPSALLDKLQSIAQSCPAGPTAEETPQHSPQTLLDKVDFYYRALVKHRDTTHQSARDEKH